MNANKGSATSKLRLLSPSKVSRRQLVLFSTALVLFGLMVIFLARAATALITVEAENMSIPAGGYVVADSTASSTKALRLDRNVTTSAQISLPATASSIAIRAKGVQCSGSPLMVIKIDGVQVSSHYVSATTWTDYSTARTLTAGAHTLSIAFTNDYSAYIGNGRLKCSRDLLLDKVTFFGAGDTSPPVSPTVKMLSPANGATVSGSIPVEATASAANGIMNVQFLLDGAVKATESAAPYCLAGDGGVPPCNSWDSKTVADGTHTITVIATDNTGIKSQPATVTFTVKNQVPPPIVGTTGVYMGPAKVAEHDQFSSWLGKETYYAVDFIDDSQTWYNIANHSNWLLDPWGAWVKAKPGRRMVISMPMLNQASAGQLAQGASGAFDSYFRTLSQNMVNKGLGNSVIRLGWESNGDWYPWKASTDPVAWKAYYRRIVGIMRSVQPTVAGQPAQSFKFDLNYNLGTSGTQIGFETIYPGSDVVDYIGLDSYDVKWQDSTSSPEVRWNNMLYQPMGLNEFKNFAASKGKPMSIPEWGLWQRGTQDGGYGDNPYYIDQMANWIKANEANVAYQSYFNHLSGWTGDHRLSSYPNSQAMYKSRFGPPTD